MRRFTIAASSLVLLLVLQALSAGRVDATASAGANQSERDGQKAGLAVRVFENGEDITPIVWVRVFRGAETSEKPLAEVREQPVARFRLEPGIYSLAVLHEDEDGDWLSVCFPPFVLTAGDERNLTLDLDSGAGSRCP